MSVAMRRCLDRDHTLLSSHFVFNKFSFSVSYVFCETHSVRLIIAGVKARRCSVSNIRLTYNVKNKLGKMKNPLHWLTALCTLSDSQVIS